VFADRGSQNDRFIRGSLSVLSYLGLTFGFFLSVRELLFCCGISLLVLLGTLLFEMIYAVLFPCSFFVACDFWVASPLHHLLHMLIFSPKGDSEIVPME